MVMRTRRALVGNAMMGDMQGLREIWNNGGTTLGGWVSVASPVTAEVTARAGFDYVCIDTQHGAVEYSDVVAMIPAIELGGGRPIARAPCCLSVRA